MKTILYVDQKFTAYINRYRVYDAQADGSKGDLSAFVEQKRGRLKEKINFFSNEDKTTRTVLFSLRAEKILDVHGKYFIEEEDGTPIGYFQKDFGRSFVKSTWHVFLADGTKLFTVTESNSTLALLRRYLGIIPLIGDIAEIIIILFKYHFVFIDPTSSKVVGKYEKLEILRDRYRLAADEKVVNTVDRRILTALAVSLDALQGR